MFRLPTTRLPDLHAEVSRPTLPLVRKRISLLDPTLEPGTAAFDAALILVAAEVIGQNIDRLARFTGIPRQTVARCGRRLVDNGVWRDGHTVSRWGHNPDDVESFRSDVGVAEGTLCRRISDDGEMEWAPQGYWRKHYEYTDPRREEMPQVVCYLPHVEMPEQVLAYVVEEEEEVVEDPEWVEARPEREEVTVPLEPTAWLGQSEAVATSEPWLGSVPAVGAELFPDVTWLG